jgi:hypothetical protein
MVLTEEMVYVGHKGMTEEMVYVGHKGFPALLGDEVKREKKASVVQTGSTAEMVCAVLRGRRAQVP